MPKLFFPRTSSSCMAVLALAAATGAALLSPSSALAKACSESAVAPRTVPQALWGELQSVGVAQDATNFNGNQRADTRYPMVTSVDIENGYIFASAYFGFQIWDARSTPVTPVKLGTADGWSGAFASWVPGNSEVDQIVFAIDAPAGDDSLAAVGGINPVGFSIWNTSNKGAPTLLYQDAPSKQIHQVYSATIGGRAYGFAAVFTGDAGIFAYDMTAARTLNRCLEDRTANVNACPGVYVGRVFSGSTQYVHGMQFGQRHFIVRSAGKNPPRSVNIIDVTNPANPVAVTSGFSNKFTAGVAMWNQGGNAYLAVRTSNQVQILDITTCLTSGCASLPAPIAIVPVAAVPESDEWKSVDFSRSGSTPMLFIGNHDLCHANESLSHTEYVFDVSNPSAPRDITPQGTLVDLGETVDYWSWYYSDFTRGFGNTAPRGGKFNGSYLYRADLTLFDVHKWTGGGSAPPVANFTFSPSEIYAGDPVTFSDTSQGSVTSRSWSFQDGSPSSGTTSPVAVTFGTSGAKSVSLSVQNAFGADQKTQTVNVISPLPAVAGVSVVPSNPVTCSVVTWTANGATGRAPLTLSWDIRDAGNVQWKTGTGNPFVWDTSTGVPPGTYTGKVTVSNASGSAIASANVTLTSPPALPTVGNFPAVTADPFTAGTVSFHVNVPGATQWNWDFGDGQSTGWISDPVTGPNPVHTYTSTGQRNVTVAVKNCVQTIPVTSPALPVNITQIAPLTIGFQAQGCFGFCAFGINQQITFDVDVAGSPDQVQFDWDGDGSYEDTRPGTQFASPTTVTHAYTAAGSYTPKARVVRGVENVSIQHAMVVISGTTPPPPPPPVKTITIGGPASGTPDAALTFSATASNCTAAASGWTWSTGGGTITGASNQSQVTITWSAAGAKTVTATNTGCSGVTGTKSVNIGNNPVPGGLAANFTVTPATPSPGQAVSFDASSSTGGPTIYQWNFGDGQTASSTTATVSHTYPNAGNYSVKLEVSKPDVTCQFGLCSASATKSVVVAGGPPPVVASFDSPSCIADFAGVRCQGDVGQAITLTSTTANATSHFWNFGDGGTASGVQVSHTWTGSGNYTVQLTVSDGRTTSSASRNFFINGPPPVTGKKGAILPLIAQTRGALVQSSDLYLLNPAASSIDVTLTFLRRGTPETNPPKVTKTIQPGATLYVADVLREMFNRENIAGFVTVSVDRGTVEPIITSFNTTVLNSKEFGQTIPGFSLSTSGSAAGTGTAQVQSLVGLNENSERIAYFGVSNPTLETASFTVKFIDNDGKQIGALRDFAVAPLGQRQFQPKDIRETFGVNNQDDYRVEIRSTTGQLFPFGSNLRLGSSDPSFIGANSAAGAKVYLLGVLSTPGINHSLWQSDVVISNTSNEVVLTDVTFTGAGSASQPTQPVHLTLQPGETRHLTDAIGQLWGVRNTVGVVTLDSNALGGVYPIVQGESYENTTPTKRFGQSLPALTEAQAAGTGASQFLAGLRQDAKNRSTVWIFNPGSQMAQYDVIYLGLDGQELGRINDVFLPAGKLQQLSPAQHKLPAAGVTSGFTVQVRVKGGKILAAAQVVKNATNDPAYIQGATR